MPVSMRGASVARDACVNRASTVALNVVPAVHDGIVYGNHDPMASGIHRIEIQTVVPQAIVPEIHFVYDVRDVCDVSPIDLERAIRAGICRPKLPTVNV